jgi:hypothetical protein
VSGFSAATFNTKATSASIKITQKNNSVGSLFDYFGVSWWQPENRHGFGQG